MSSGTPAKATAGGGDPWAKDGAVAASGSDLQTKQKAVVKDGKAGIFMASFNLSNAILGAGVGGMPFALYEAGFYAGILLLLIVAASSDYSVRMLVRLAQQVKKK